MEQILQNKIPKSKGVTDVLEASLKVCKKCLLLDVQKKFDAAQPNRERKRFAYPIYDEWKRSLLVDIKKFLKMLLNMPVPGSMERDGKSFILSPVTILSEILKILEVFSDTVSMSQNINHLSSKTEYSVAPNNHHMNSKTNQILAFPKHYDVATVKDNSNLLRGESDQKCRHKFSVSFKHKAKNMASVGRYSHRQLVATKISRSPLLNFSDIFLGNRVADLSSNLQSKIIHHIMKIQQNYTSKVTKDFSDHSERYSAQSVVHTRMQPESTVLSHVMSPNCNIRNLSCMTEVLKPGRKRSSTFPLEHDTEFAHLPKAALKFLSYSSISCPSIMNEPLIHQVDPQILNSLPVQPSWLPYQLREPLGGCPTQLWPHTNPARIWPRILLMAECVCDGSRCTLRGTHRCITIKVAVVSLIRDTREGRDQVRNVRRRMEMVAVGCVCAEQKSVLLHEHRPPILE
jgi:hypothetical protein